MNKKEIETIIANLIRVDQNINQQVAKTDQKVANLEKENIALSIVFVISMRILNKSHPNLVQDLIEIIKTALTQEPKGDLNPSLKKLHAYLKRMKKLINRNDTPNMGH